MSLKFALQKTQSQLVQRILFLPVKYVMFPLQWQELGEIKHCIDLLQVFYSILCSEKSYDHIISNFNFDLSWSWLSPWHFLCAQWGGSWQIWSLCQTVRRTQQRHPEIISVKVAVFASIFSNDHLKRLLRFSCFGQLLNPKFLRFKS